MRFTGGVVGTPYYMGPILPSGLVLPGIEFYQGLMAIWGIQRGVGNEIWGDMGDLRNVQFVTDFGDFLRLKRHF